MAFIVIFTFALFSSSQVCVWCWHHIIDMAEKDQTEGRCPACRTIYEKEKIIAMQANSERFLVFFVLDWSSEHVQMD